MSTWESALEKIVDNYHDSLYTNGFTPSVSFTQTAKEMEFSPKLTTPNYVSLDFWSSVNPSQSGFLRSKNLYILRTGKGNFSIINGEIFPKPYLNLDVSSCIELKISETDRFPSLEDAVRESQENIGLEQLHYFGIYQKIIDDVVGKTNYHIGPRGGRRSSFPVFARNNSGEAKKIFDFDGTEELDYTIWTKDSIFMIEAKSTKYGNGLDIGLHKILYPASRFRKYVESSGYRIIPVYLLRWENTFHVFVFSDVGFYDSGIILNDSKYLTPAKCYKAEIFSG